MTYQGGWGKNWDELLKNYSSGEDSDEFDTPNIVSFQKNVKRNAQLIQSFIPHMTPEGVETIPPLLMRDPYVMHKEISEGTFLYPRSGEIPAESESFSQVVEEKEEVASPSKEEEEKEEEPVAKEE